MSEKSLEIGTNRFLAFVVLAATGFLGEVQLADFDRYAADPLSRIVLTLSTIFAALIGGWGAFASAVEFTDIAVARSGSRQAGVVGTHYPWAANVGDRLQRSLEELIVESVERKHRIMALDAIVLGFLLVLVLLIVWAIF